jgi:acyl CoA:acetate/3-ketoacid CoA transferase beta subunit
MNDSEIAALLTCCLAREIVERDVVGVGLGTPAGLAAALLAQRTHAPSAQVIVSGAVSPRAGVAECLAGAAALAGRAAGFISHLETMEMAERRAMTLQFLRPAQVDADASLNVSRVPGEDGVESRLPGGLATADVTRLLGRIVLYHTDHRERSLPARVSYRTAIGGGDALAGTRGPVSLVTDRAVLDFEDGAWRVRSIHPGQDPADVERRTGFPLAGAARAPRTPRPSAAELDALTAVDGLALRELEFRATRAAATARLASVHH